MGKYDDDADDTSTNADEGSATADEDLGTEVPNQKARKVIKRGWGNAEQTRSADSPFAQRFQIGQDPQVVKFLEDDPYTSYRQHWIERQGQKSFTCISDMHEKGCPLCAAGDRPSARFAFNVALMTEDNDPLIKSYEVGPRDIDSLKQFHTDPRQGPLPKHYWAISRTGKAGTSQRIHNMVRERDLFDEWEIKPITDAQLAAVEKTAYTENIVSIPSYKTIKDIATEELGE